MKDKIMNEKKFLAEYKKLNPQQKKAVDEIEDQGHYNDHDKQRQHWPLSRA